MVAGHPTLLRSFTDALSAVVPTLRTAADDCSTAIAAYNDAANDLPASDLEDVGAAYGLEADALGELAAVPAAFATLVEAADGNGALLARLDQLLLDTWVATPSFADAEALLAELTGTPAAMADDLRALLAATGELSDDEVDDLIRSYRDALALDIFQVGRTYGDVVITDDNQAEIIWSSLRDGERWDDALPARVIDELLSVSARITVVARDADFAAALFDDLGGADTARLPGLVARAAWSDEYTTGGQGFDAPGVMGTFSAALATASGELPGGFWDDTFAAAVERTTVEDPNLGWWGDHEAVAVDDAFPALFIAGRFAPDVAARAGQLGIDILTGQRADGLWVQVDRGQGSPLYAGFDRMQTRWEDRGTMLVEAASRTPEAATQLLRDERNAAILTDDHFGRDGRADHAPSWHVAGDEVGHLIRAGTIENLAADPDGTREAAANVINMAVDDNPGASHDALATTYAEVGAQYLPELAVDNQYGTPAALEGDHLAIGSLPAARFVAMGMASEEGAAILTAAHQVVSLDIVTGGVEDQYAGVGNDWEQRLGKLDAVMLAGRLGDSFDTAEDARAAALDYNANLATGQGALLRAVGLAPHTRVLMVGVQPVADHIRTEYLNHATNQVEIAESDANVAEANAYDAEERLVASGHLVAVLRAEAAAPPGAHLGADQQAVLAVAEAQMSPETLHRLREAAAGSAPLLDAVEGGALAHDLDRFREAFAGHEEWPVDDDYLAVAEWQDRHMSEFPAGLFIED
jgi:hypothetical protein